jgi:ABC-type uncharacterized transport system YnjBCD ATPase subunit
MENEPVISVNNLVRSFGGRVVLDGINMTVEKGKITAIMGASWLLSPVTDVLIWAAAQCRGTMMKRAGCYHRLQ